MHLHIRGRADTVARGAINNTYALSERKDPKLVKFNDDTCDKLDKQVHHLLVLRSSEDSLIPRGEGVRPHNDMDCVAVYISLS
jgi:fructosamine-3-kinase